MPVPRQAELARRRRRRAKTRVLKERIAKARDESQIARLLEKLKKVNPYIRVENS